LILLVRQLPSSFQLILELRRQLEVFLIFLAQMHCKTSGAGNTVTIGTNGTLPDTFNADVGSAVPVLGIIGFAGGNNIGTTAAGSTVTINVDGTTNHAVQVGNVSGSLTSIAVGLTGQVLTGNWGKSYFCGTRSKRYINSRQQWRRSNRSHKSCYC